MLRGNDPYFSFFCLGIRFRTDDKRGHLLGPTGGGFTFHEGMGDLDIHAGYAGQRSVRTGDAPPAEREASGSPLEGGWIKLSSIKI